MYQNSFVRHNHNVKGTQEKQRTARSGFTLIELLVVIAIISILATILLPALSQAQDMAKSVKCASNLRGMATMVAFYQNDFAGLFPTGWDGTYTSFAKLAPYADMETEDFKLPYPQGFIGFELAYCPTNENNRIKIAYPSNYVTNSHLFLSTTLASKNLWKYWNITSEVSANDLTTPAEDMMYAESGSNGSSPYALSHLIPSLVNILSLPHGGGTACNICFADGHVGSSTQTLDEPLPVAVDEVNNRLWR